MIHCLTGILATVPRLPSPNLGVTVATAGVSIDMPHGLDSGPAALICFPRSRDSQATVCPICWGARRGRSATLRQSQKGFHERTAALQRVDALSAVHGGVVLELWRILQIDG